MSSKTNERNETEKPIEHSARKLAVRKLDKIETTDLSSPNG